LWGKVVNFDSILDLINNKKNKNINAIIFNDNKISYSELDELSDRFAKNIINKGIEPGSTIALGLYNDIDLIPSLLAIWKANCTYLPIDPNYPFGRVETMLNDACPKLLMTNKNLSSNFHSLKVKLIS